MTPKEKAKQLYELTRYDVLTLKGTEALINEVAKKCALIAVDEIMKAPHINQYIELIPSDADDTDWFWDKFDEYWNQVKQEIKNI